MQIIPVLDLLDGSVVHGVGGNRIHYKPIDSIICRSSEPLEVVESVLGFFPFDIVYIADLNALQGTGCSNVIIDSLSRHFPETEFWVDAGINRVADLEQYLAIANVTPIIASECIENIAHYKSLVKQLNARQYLLSLDHKNGELGATALFRDSQLWPDSVIVMDLDTVGKGAGPALDLLAHYQSRSPSTAFFSAGGVRNIEDIESLISVNAAGTLVASALHNGQLSSADLVNIDKKNAPHSGAF